MKCEATTCMQA